MHKQAYTANDLLTLLLRYRKDDQVVRLINELTIAYAENEELEKELEILRAQSHE